MTPIFADTMVQVSLTGSLVRIELGAFAMVNKDGKQTAQLVPTHQLVMPLDGFVRGFGVQQQAVNKLIADGTLKSQDPQAETLAPAPGAY